jgi:hypothetical protein
MIDIARHCMRIKLFITTLLTIFLLQACGGQTTKAESQSLEDSQQLSDQALTDTENNNRASQNTFHIQPIKDEQLTTPETQIIRELYHAGCIIEDFELDRRKQYMRISCVKDIKADNSSI